MRILFPTRLDAEIKSGGDSRLVHQYAHDLRSLGCEVVVSGRLHEDYSSFDVVHFININNAFEIYLRLLRIRSGARRPAVVLTPLHHKTEWMLPYYRRAIGIDLGTARDQGDARFNALITLKDLVRFGMTAARIPTFLAQFPFLAASTFRQKRYIVNHVDALLVHSEEEATAVRADCRTGPTPSFDVPVGWNKPRQRPAVPTLPRDYILSVGRIEPLKNQLALIEATRSLNAPLVLIGVPNLRHRGYVRRFRAALADSRDVIHLPIIEHGALEAVYQNARLHVLASWYEVFPLTTVEAAANGCRVTTTCRSYEAGIYKTAVLYLDPEGVSLIRAGIEQTLTDRSLGVPNAVTSQLPSWRGVAKRLLDVYRLVARDKE